ncbi:MAG TPA: hypothetical protein PKY35_09560 [Candidatus Hydrogenedentes bacterium]|nr:hypothetical protein [Candidatus Hydrogenedentota bacterium]HOL77264.1 hypothetical protein [Candidatus Hydrogenedentota bacterium]HPO86555.1 hypothetical protein [Candidatus Hydrogenedentota bacterium]
MKRWLGIILVVVVIFCSIGCGQGKQQETTIKLDQQDQQGVQKALEFKQQMDKQIKEQMMRNLPPPPAKPAAPAQ